MQAARSRPRLVPPTAAGSAQSWSPAAPEPAPCIACQPVGKTEKPGSVTRWASLCSRLQSRWVCQGASCAPVPLCPLLCSRSRRWEVFLQVTGGGGFGRGPHTSGLALVMATSEQECCSLKAFGSDGFLCDCGLIQLGNTLKSSAKQTHN